ncbi:hypothetical protein GFU95_00520 [Apibacter sp. B3889]|uniref:hypothetical protein n=1 Tax=unclassified Apibacter TaxID=2630820 RepID=UPI0013254B9C|nr:MULTISPECIES: hypothetical protein [unclassified Apibacter]MXO33496.1 hypothetical protein [Apibacter sp. B3883]MXO40853.1 hypothetical protein [Apibacter sp. B3889]MXP04022.1 hypothetical protein [Apibacter sp. B3887]MXP07167.1 hypothetical protein [Apibacter sp. B3935]
MNKFIETLRYYWTRDSKWNYLFIIIPFILLYMHISYKHNPVEYGNYTIGYIDRIYWPIVNHKKVSYEYTVNDKVYSSSSIYRDSADPKVGHYYLVQFSLEDNSYSKIYQDIPVPDSIKQAPPGGWKERPEWAKGK